MFLKAVEMQKEVQCRQFKELLKEKEEEIQLMSQSFDPDFSRQTSEDAKILQGPAVISTQNDDRVKDLENQLRSEREAHQNEILSIQVNTFYNIFETLLKY